eukprot:9910527-Alexandrium_andersonii.AAC.1
MSASLVGLGDVYKRQGFRVLPSPHRRRTHFFKFYLLLHFNSLLRVLPPVSYTHLTLPTICSV